MKTLFNKNVAKDYDALVTLIGNVHEVIENRTTLKFKKVHGEKGYNYYGYELQVRQNVWVFFGTWTDVWIVTGCPMVVSALDETVKFKGSKKQLEKYFLENKPALVDFGEYIDNYCLSFSVELLEGSTASEKIAKIVLEVVLAVRT